MIKPTHKKMIIDKIQKQRNQQLYVKVVYHCQNAVLQNAPEMLFVKVRGAPIAQ